LGAFLSGGIDSSVIVSLATRHSPHINTFSIGYKDEPYFDETYYANLVAKKCGTNHTVFSLTNNDLYENLQDALDYIDEPFADSSALAVYILSKYTRQHVTVALSGDAGDELFGGYMKHVAEWRARHLRPHEQLIRFLKPVWGVLPQSRSSKWGNTFRQLNKFAEIAGLDNARRYWRLCTFNNVGWAKQMLTDYDINSYQILQQNLVKGLTADSDMNDVLLADMGLVLQNDMLTKVDLMSMANSLEVRTPFLDYTVVDFAFGLPADYKTKGNLRKRIVHDAFRHMLPEELYNRPKRGFEVPLLKWMRNELWTKIDTHWLNQDLIHAQGIFKPEAIQQVKDKLRSKNPGDAHAQIWALIVFQNWWLKYMQS
jgi:asparagine synthase (glutamine-hydrolysing)